jgi:hypothetical protein
VDARAKTYLTDEEAAGIRALGFEAAMAGWWDVPPLPPQLVLGDQRLEHLCRGWLDPARPATEFLRPEPGLSPSAGTAVAGRHGGSSQRLADAERAGQSQSAATQGGRFVSRDGEPAAWVRASLPAGGLRDGSSPIAGSGATTRGRYPSRR